MSDERIESQFWFNTTTHQVEQGMQSPNRDRIGPFDTREEAQAALDRVRANNARWDQEDAQG
ncbi:SPOR domain-containing protein [Curtobacterium sp. MCBD17_013]|uniref:SPOR domain-containing protein n=1 Tax=unclassified Curtobacterium TaxID=257496 RepID=UPI000DAAAFEE|nr:MULTISPECIES: SPOR domain-containing protein [unclassified Curtobacterium]PZF66375.1 SPOR domain-containing protein [Curtobacterium sp. MCBD17_013]WIB64948.1 SPOR domain-containing protein [Curtobacterium sp. MCBD17_040]